MKAQDYTIYKRCECVLFLRTTEQFGGLSNMAGGYPLTINGIHILTAEALYQACRFPHLPDVQRLIIGQKSPMTAKMKSKPYRQQSRSDWDEKRIAIMYWCLRVKLAQHWNKFGNLLLSTGTRQIVEESHRDQFWGAKPINAEELVGLNTLGNLLMELREELKQPDAYKLRSVEPPELPNFNLINQPIKRLDDKKTSTLDETSISQISQQLSLFEKPFDIPPFAIHFSNETVQYVLYGFNEVFPSQLLSGS